MKLPILFHMRAAARCQKEGCWERPPQRIPYLKLECYSIVLFCFILNGTPNVKFPILFRMRAAARCQKEGCWERPPQRIPYLKLDCYLIVWCVFNFERNPKNEIPVTIPHARCRADAKREVSGEAPEANSLFKTWFFESPPRLERCRQSAFRGSGTRTPHPSLTWSVFREGTPTSLKLI